MKKSHRITIQAAGFAVRALVNAILTISLPPTKEYISYVEVARNHLRLMSEFIESAVEVGEEEEANGRD